jgi:hypothetical protein
VLPPERDYAVLRRSIAFALNDVARRGRAGAPARRRAHAARPPRQRARPAAARAGRCSSARRWTLLSSDLLSAEGLRLSPALQRRVAPDFWTAPKAGRQHRLPGGAAPAGPAARRARLPDERWPGRAHPGQRGQVRRAGARLPAQRAARPLARDLWGDWPATRRIVDTVAPGTAARTRESPGGRVLRPMPGTRVDARGLVAQSGAHPAGQPGPPVAAARAWMPTHVPTWPIAPTPCARP